MRNHRCNPIIPMNTFPLYVVEAESVQPLQLLNSIIVA